MAASQKVTVKKTKTTTKRTGLKAVSGKRKTRSDKGKKHKKRNSA